MLESVGLYDIEKLTENEKEEFIRSLYVNVYKGKNKSKKSIQAKAKEYVASWKYRYSTEMISGKKRFAGVSIFQHYTEDNKTEIAIEMMGIWDTVEALGTRATAEAIKDKQGIEEDKQTIVKPNPNYYESLCNVENISHALALDDNRAYVFTPIIASSERYFQCNDRREHNISSIVNEVWFSGAHTDVGGGGYNYKYSNLDRDLNLPGVSMNWMIDEIK